MAHVLERVPVGRITEEARTVRFGRTALAVLAGLLYVIGWTAAKTVGAAWFAVAWIAVAVKLGWSDARGADGRGRGSA